MKTYELLLIISPQFSDDELPDVLDGVFGVVRNENGEVKQHKVIGRQALAYPINHMKHGCYIITEVEVETEALVKINRAFRLMPEILRFDISKKVSGQEFSFREEKKPLAEKIIEEKIDEQKLDGQKLTEIMTEPELASVSADDKDDLFVKPAQRASSSAILEGETESERLPEKEDILTEPAAQRDERNESRFIKITEDKEKKIPLEDLDKKLEEILNEEVL